MTSGPDNRGFTIVETLMFLAVSALILVSALGLFSGSQNKNQFYQAVNDINQQISDVINNVSNGYYPNTFTNYRCTDTGGKPALNPAGSTVQQGENQECIFLGRIIEFTNTETFYVLNVVGLRQQTGTNNQVTTMVQAKPKIIEPIPTSADPTYRNYPDSTEKRSLKNGLTLTKAYYERPPRTDVVAVGFFSTLAANNTGGLAGDLQSKGLNTEFAPAGRFSLNVSRNTFLEDFNNNFGGQYGGLSNPESGVVLCFRSSATNQFAKITVGGSGQQTATKLEVVTSCP